MPAKKRKGVCRKTAAAAVNAQDEEPEMVKQGPQVTQGAQGTVVRQRVDVPATGASKEKRPPLRLDLEQEGVVFEFVEAHQELYSKGHPAFLKTGQKLALWQQLADTLKATDFDGSIATGPRVMTWWSTQRSAYGKVTRSVSGQGAKRLTAREKRLKECLAFLSAHVYRVPKRAGVNLMGQLREKHPERFDVPVPSAQGRSPRESDTDSEHEQTTHLPHTGTQTQEPDSASSQMIPSSASRKRKPSHVLLETIEKRLAANQQLTAQIVQQEDNTRSAFGRMVGLSAAEMDAEAFDGLQVDITALLVKYKRESRVRAQVASVTQVAPRPPPLPQMPPGATIHHTIADFSLSSGLAIQQSQQCPEGFLPNWQRQYQPPQQQHQVDEQQADQQQRPSSAPIDFLTALGNC